MSRRPYIRPVSKTTWYMRNKRYKVYVLRELSSFLVAFYTFYTICALAILATGSAEKWDSFLASQQCTGMVVFHAAALLYFLFFQTFPWFKLAPKASIVDGLIDVSAVGDYPIAERLVRLPQVRAGKHADWKRVTYRQVPEVSVASEKKLIAHLDGEPYRLPGNEFTVAVLPDSLRVLVPAKSA